MMKFTKYADVSEVSDLLKSAFEFKSDPFKNKMIGDGKILGLLFFNPSLRTRLSTHKAALNLGMHCLVMNINSDGWKIEFEDGSVMNNDSQEHIKEAAMVLSAYCDIIGIRTFPSLTNRTSDYEEVLLNQFLKYSEVPVISLESAIRHPLQSFADLMTIHEHTTVEVPKVVLTWAPHPKKLPQAVANSFVEWMQNAAVNLVITNPPGFNLSTEFTKNIEVCHNQNDALKEADFVYVKNWSSYENYGTTSEVHEDWQITPSKLLHTNNAKVMHCLPVRRNVELSDAVLDGPNSLTKTQVINRIYAAQAVLYKLISNEN